MKPTAYDGTTPSGTQPLRNMTTMGKIDTSNLMMIIRWDITYISYWLSKLKLASLTHTPPPPPPHPHPTPHPNQPPTTDNNHPPPPPPTTTPTTTNHHHHHHQQPPPPTTTHHHHQPNPTPHPNQPPPPATPTPRIAKKIRKVIKETNFIFDILSTEYGQQAFTHDSTVFHHMCLMQVSETA